MSDNQLIQRSGGADAAKTSQNPLDEAGDAGAAARGQSSELNAVVGQAIAEGKALGREQAGLSDGAVGAVDIRAGELYGQVAEGRRYRFALVQHENAAGAGIEVDREHM